uniref:Uncharacterized protein n=1 Tax=Arundo donax TaxID=35708 RepID=A0A0A8YGQ4_ARUDO
MFSKALKGFRASAMRQRVHASTFTGLPGFSAIILW